MKTVKEEEGMMFVIKKEGDAQKPRGMKTVKCFKCHKMGHYTRECSEKKAGVMATTVDK